MPQSQTAALPDIKRKRKQTNPNKHKSIKHTKSTKISSLFPKRGNHNAKKTEKHKMAQGKAYNELPRRINHKAPKSKTNTGTTNGQKSSHRGFKALLQLANFTLGPDATLIQKYIKIRFHASKRKHKNQINHFNKQRQVLMAYSTVFIGKPIVNHGGPSQRHIVKPQPTGFTKRPSLSLRPEPPSCN